MLVSGLGLLSLTIYKRDYLREGATAKDSGSVQKGQKGVGVVRHLKEGHQAGEKKCDPE